MKKIIILSLLTGFIALNMYGNEPVYKFKKALDKGNSKEVSANIDFLAGQLIIKNTTKNLAQCLYGAGDDNAFIRPLMSYKERGHMGYLNIESEKLKNRNIHNFDDNGWLLLLNPTIIKNLSIRLKAGEANIELEGSKLERLEYKMMAGETHLNLRDASLPDMEFSMMAGEATIDLSGKWRNDLQANIKGGVGELTIYVPYDVGARIYVSGLIGEVKIPFFNQNGKTYTNDLYGRSKHTLFINIDAGIGEVNVKMKE